MKRIFGALIICILCIQMFSVMIPHAGAQTGSGTVVTGVYTNPVPPGCGFINFEDGVNGSVIRSTISGLNFTTTLGYDWVYADIRTGNYNGRSLTDPTVNYGSYVVNGYLCAWLGVNAGEGRIDFVNGARASYVSVLTSTQSGLEMDAYNSSDNLIATSGWANGNLGTYTFTRLTVQAPNIAYVLIHDTGNYWIIDDLVADVGEPPGPGSLQLGQQICACNGNISRFIYYANSSANEVDVYSQSTLSVVAPPIPVGKNPVSLATFKQPPPQFGSYYSLLGNIVLCTNQGDGTVSLINSTTNSVITTQMVGTAPFGIATSTITGQAFITDFENDKIIVMTLRQFPQITTYSIGLNDSPTGIAVEPYTNTVYVSLYNSHSIEVIYVNPNAQNSNIQGTILVGAYPMGLGLDQDDDLWVANSGSATVSMAFPPSAQSSSLSIDKVDFPVDSNPVGVAIIDGGYNEGYQTSVLVSYQSSNKMTFISRILWETQQSLTDLTYDQVIPGVSSFNATAAVTIDTARNNLVYINTVPVDLETNSPSSFIINENLVVGPPAFYSGGVYMPTGTYQISYSIPAGYTYESLTATGDVTLSADLTSISVMGAGTVELSAQQIPNWQNSNYFSVSPFYINLGGIQSVLTSNNGLAQYPIGIYLISASQSTSETQFIQQLQYYFNISVPSGYDPLGVILVHIPMVHIFSTILNQNLPQQAQIYPLAGSSTSDAFYTAFFNGYPYLKTDDEGNLNIAITFSLSTNMAKTASDLIKLFFDALSAAWKTDAAQMVKAFVDAVKTILDTADATVNIITSDITQTASLASYQLMDLLTVSNVLSTAITIGGIILDVVHMITYLPMAVEDFMLAAVSIPPFDAYFALSGIFRGLQGGLAFIDASVQMLSLVFPDLNNNAIFLGLKSAVSAAVSIVDPNGSNIYPSFYDSTGSLVLGYNEFSGAFLYNSSEGILFRIADSYYSYLNENPAEPTSYVLQLSQVGGNDSVPYVVTVRSFNTTAPIISYAGILTSGSTLSIPTLFSGEGTLVHAPYLSPHVIVSETGTGFDLLVIPYTSDGVLTTASSGFVVVNSTDYGMQELNSSAFECLIPYSDNSSNIAMVYLFSPGLAGGYVPIQLLTARECIITFDQLGVNSDFAGTVVVVDGAPYGFGALPMSFYWTVDSVHTFAFQSPLMVEASAERYIWNSTTGLSSMQRDSINVTTDGSIVGNYKTQCNVTISQTGVGSDFNGTVVVIDGTNYTAIGLPASFWWDEGSSHNFSFTSHLNVNVSRGYCCWSTSGLSSLMNGTLTISASGNVAATFGLIGDLNHDGNVSLTDLVMFAASWHSCPGDPNWNPECDIAAPYGIIGLSDFVTLAMHYGQHYP